MRTAKHPSPGRHRGHRGAAAVEFAILLPVLTTLLVGIVDFSRLFYHYTIITDCARNGALYASDTTVQVDSPYYNSANRATSVRDAALADAVGLSPQSVVTITEDSNARVAVSVTYQFNLITSYLGTGPINLTRTVWMNAAPAIPN